MGTALLMFMVTSISNLPPFDDKHINMFKLVYVALIVYVIICFIGPLTGAHINPAVTLAAYIDRKKRKGQIKVVLTYWAAQF